MTNIAIVLLSLAVLLNASVTAWMLWHYTRGMRASSAWLDGLTEKRKSSLAEALTTADPLPVGEGARFSIPRFEKHDPHSFGEDGIKWTWDSDRLVTPEERQDDAWVAEIDAQTEADAMEKDEVKSWR